MTIRCLLVRKDTAGGGRRSVEPLSRQAFGADPLADGEALLRVAYSSLNYKDALAATGSPAISKLDPLVPGIDAAGTVLESRSSEFKAGDDALVTGYGLGVERFGGFADCVVAPAAWLVPLPAGLSLKESMIYGTAGFTAAQSVAALIEHGVEPGGGPVLVTGASGGVGAVAVALLAKLGYDVHAATGKASAQDLLVRLGAARILSREETLDASPRPLLGAKWAGVVDVVGGSILATAIRSTRPGGCVTCCGLTAGPELPLSVFPFILRGVALVGIDSVDCPMPRRRELWSRLAGPWKPALLDQLVAQTVSLDELEAPIQAILAGQITGRVLVKP